MKTKTINNFSTSNSPIASLNLGEKVIVEVLDKFNGQLTYNNENISSLKADKLNPATGPFYIRNTYPEEILVVNIHQLTAESIGVSTVFPDLGVLGEKIEKPESFFYNLDFNTIGIEEGKIEFTPFISIIGTTPNKLISTGVPANHGGKVDCPNLKQGCKILLPIFQEGSLLALGGIKAMQGFGQVAGTGIECGGEIAFSCNKTTIEALKTPMVISEEGYEILASHYNLEKAIHMATEQWCYLLEDICGFSFPKSYHYLSIASNLSIVQLVNPNVTVSLSIHKSIILDKLKLFFSLLDK
ncbi:acetamidase/formamidase family protein [Proteinivorax tanatarense]|uniref:Acetamidase/formamidase family protein n=1 Tax=Proteinivorax tanatarense TaxID=1260629 RepID=A0AAU7VMM4_9FIRM